MPVASTPSLSPDPVDPGLLAATANQSEWASRYNPPFTREGPLGRLWFPACIAAPGFSEGDSPRVQARGRGCCLAPEVHGYPASYETACNWGRAGEASLPKHPC